MTSAATTSAVLERFSVEDDVRDFYRRNGYVVFTDLFTGEQLDRAAEEIIGLFARRLGVSATSLDDARAVLVEQHLTSRDRWRECASRMWDLLGVYGLAAEPRVERALRGLGLEAPAISTRPEVRTDLPGDQDYRQPWHQDWRYGQGSINAVTIWTPLHDVSRTDGTIDLIPGSHVRGFLETELLTNPRRFAIADPGLDAEEFVTAEMQAGEAVVFSQFLVHRSGHNTSDRARLTMQTRFSDFAEPRFVAAGYPTPRGDDLVWDEPPDAAELAAAFA